MGFVRIKALFVKKSYVYPRCKKEAFGSSSAGKIGAVSLLLLSSPVHGSIAEVPEKRLQNRTSSR